MKRILLTNDDGIDADGLIRLAAVAQKYAEVWIVAPEGQRSAMSHSVTLRHSIEAWEVPFPIEGIKAYACNGTPADCVRIGALNILSQKPDYVLTGINYGYNVATDLQYSATVGAAMEGAFQKIPSIAFSEEASDCHEVSDNYLDELLGDLLARPLYSTNKIWNVNFPGCSLEECKGVLWDRRVSMDEFYRDRYHETKLADGRTSYMVDGQRNYEATPETDLNAVLNQYVSVGIVTNIS